MALGGRFGVCILAFYFLWIKKNQNNDLLRWCQDHQNAKSWKFWFLRLGVNTKHFHFVVDS